MMLPDLKQCEIWFVTGSQILYGEAVLKKVATHSKEIVEGMNGSGGSFLRIIQKETLISADGIYELCLEANRSQKCVGVILWMHTFSPAKMWIRGLNALQKPILHFHTQFNRDIPWKDIDMDFMNLNQSAHGDREFGFIGARMNLQRKVVVGHWQDKDCMERIDAWGRAALARHDWQGAKIARFGDNMRQVAVTEGNKVSAEIKFGFSTNGFGMGDLAERIKIVSEKDVNNLVDKYLQEYNIVPSLKKGGDKHSSLIEAARIELGLRGFLEGGDFNGFTDTFEDLHGLVQLPGIAVQRLMRDGYGFGAEGDWKTSALVRAMKVMGSGLKGGNSFMEDYTYHFHPDGHHVLGAHMLEICESIAASKPSCEIHPLSIGGKADPVRLVFDVEPGSAINVTLIDLGHRFRMLINKVEITRPMESLPNLPVARALWKPIPDLKTSATAWILAGGGHHTCLSQCLSAEHLEDFCEMMDIELITIDENTRISEFKKELRWNEEAFRS